jgi:hypothetical protein
MVRQEKGIAKSGSSERIGISERLRVGTHRENAPNDLRQLELLCLMAQGTR